MITHKQFNEKALPVISGLVGEKSAKEIIEAIRPLVRDMAFSIIESSVKGSIDMVKGISDGK